MYNIDNSIDKKYVFKSQIDKIRNDLLAKGIVLKDTREGTIYEISA